MVQILGVSNAELWPVSIPGFSPGGGDPSLGAANGLSPPPWHWKKKLEIFDLCDLWTKIGVKHQNFYNFWIKYEVIIE